MASRPTMMEKFWEGHHTKTEAVVAEKVEQAEYEAGGDAGIDSTVEP